jgi:hypothetical protein
MLLQCFLNIEALTTVGCFEGFRKESDAKKQDSKRKEVARKRKAGDSNGADGDIHVNGRLDEAVTMAEDEGFTD